MNAVVQFQAPRLPYHPAVEERFGVDRSGWKVLCEAVFPAAESPDSIVMALAYCRARNLDIFKKPVQIVPIYDKKRGGMVDTVWPGIAELRTTAMRTGSFAGFDETQFGPDIETTLGGVPMIYPEWSQCIVYRLIAGQRVPFIGPKTYWLETYATAKRDTAAPNAMWKKRPRGQLEKCAEAAALRRAFPEELGNEYAAEEVSGREIGAGGTPTTTVIAEAKHLALHAGFDDPSPAGDAAHNPETGEVIDAEIEEQTTGEPHDAFPGDQGAAHEEKPSSDLPEGVTRGSDIKTEKEWSEILERDLRKASAAGDVKGLEEIWARASGLRNRLDRANPERLAELEGALNECYLAAEEAAKGGA